ncbi:MAG: metallophosphoesterase [Clostridia bacterium]|nr:metallophosphoesterase [Clostridia bacterium]
MLYKDPCVFVVDNAYQIAFNTLEKGLAWVEIGGETYRDSRNGLMISETLIHKICVPMQELDDAGSYTVYFRALPERKPYFPELGTLRKAHYAFKPVKGDAPVNICFLADTHSDVEAPSRAAANMPGETDLLILAGDIPAESKTLDDIRAIYDLTSEITHGEIPVVFARGNHDLRGKYATELTQYIGTRNGETWFTFRLGSLWGIVLDCGEDKNDDHPEYGGLLDCHAMRLEETRWMRSMAKRAQEEYAAPGITTRIAICHQPFTTEYLFDGDPGQFDIERMLYGEWTQLLNQMHIDMMLCGHSHLLAAVQPGDPASIHPAQFPVVIAATPLRGESCPYWPHEDAAFAGSRIQVNGSRVSIEAVDNIGNRESML